MKVLNVDVPWICSKTVCSTNASRIEAAAWAAAASVAFTGLRELVVGGCLGTRAAVALRLVFLG
jgi:hypothetical protein